MIKRVRIPELEAQIDRDEDEAHKDEIVAYAEKYLESAGWVKDDSNDKTRTVKIPESIFEKFKTIMDKSNLTYYI